MLNLHRAKIQLYIYLCKLRLWRPLYNETVMEIIKAMRGTGDVDNITRIYMQCPGIYIGAIIMLSDAFMKSARENDAKQLLRSILPNEQVP